MSEPEVKQKIKVDLAELRQIRADLEFMEKAYTKKIIECSKKLDHVQSGIREIDKVMAAIEKDSKKAEHKKKLYVINAKQAG